MDQKTEELRDIFMDVSEEEAVTESQEASRGSLTDTDEADVADRLADVISRMRERYGFETDIDDEALATVVRLFYEGSDDAAIAADLGVDEADVVEARLDLHLLRDEDTETPFDLTVFRRRVADDDPTISELATEFDIDESWAAHYRRVVGAQDAARRVSHRFQSEFEDVLTDAGLSTQHAASLRDDGLDEATEDIDSLDSGTDVSM
ncbi:MAG: conditioned medium-induced protein 4 [Haloarcula sp.]